MKWPWKRKKRLVLTLGEVYELGSPYNSFKPEVRLVEVQVDLGGWITLRFTPDVHELKLK